MPQTKWNLTEEQQNTLMLFFQEAQSAYLPDLKDFHGRLSAVPGIPEEIIRDLTRIYRLMKAGWEETANNLQGDDEA